jgi:signal transduction histidine kinase
MRKGDLNTKVDDKVMVGAFKDFAGELNALAGAAVVAAQKQMGSQRGRNRMGDVSSQELREPLDTLLCYAGLLGSARTEEEKAEYLEVIHRELNRMDQLLGKPDSENNMAVEIVRLDAVEAVAQVLEEYADKLSNAHLTPVVRYADSYASMLADEWMLWRVLSNLLDNAVSHALAGTRVYLDVNQTDDEVSISLKNISREALDSVRENPAESKESEGSGLRIAASLMQLQNGKLQLQTDGDLFKATLIFPKD